MKGTAKLCATTILRALLIHLAPIWPERLRLGGVLLGDCWRHSAIKRNVASDGLMPLHKLSQWLSYSLIEPLQNTGVTVTDIDGLTELAEYRNGACSSMPVIAFRVYAGRGSNHANFNADGACSQYSARHWS